MWCKPSRSTGSRCPTTGIIAGSSADYEGRSGGGSAWLSYGSDALPVGRGKGHQGLRGVAVVGLCTAVTILFPAGMSPAGAASTGQPSPKIVAPDPRVGAGFAYAVQRQQLVLFGGAADSFGAGFLND